MDGVLADTETHFIKWYFDTYGVKLTYAQLIGKAEEDIFPVKEAVRNFLITPGFFKTIPVMPGAVEALSELVNEFDVYIVSTATQHTPLLTEKQEWLNEHFPFISWNNIVFCGDKSSIQADYMIDDHPKNFNKFKGMPILFNAAHNAFINDYHRVKNWTDVVKLLQGNKENTKKQLS